MKSDNEIFLRSGDEIINGYGDGEVGDIGYIVLNLLNFIEMYVLLILIFFIDENEKDLYTIDFFNKNFKILYFIINKFYCITIIIIKIIIL